MIPVNSFTTMRPKQNLQLRRIGSQYMIVDSRTEQVNLSHVFRMNRTAADIWQQMNEGCSTPEALAEWLCDNYEVDRDTALADVKRLLDSWTGFGLLVEEGGEADAR